MDLQVLDIDKLANDISDCTFRYLEINKKATGNVPYFIELIIGAHLTSMYNHLRSYANFTNCEQLKKDIDVLFDGIMDSLNKIGMIYETYSYDKRGH